MMHAGRRASAVAAALGALLLAACAGGEDAAPATSDPASAATEVAAPAASSPAPATTEAAAAAFDFPTGPAVTVAADFEPPGDHVPSTGAYLPANGRPTLVFVDAIW